MIDLLNDLVAEQREGYDLDAAMLEHLTQMHVERVLREEDEVEYEKRQRG